MFDHLRSLWTDKSTRPEFEWWLQYIIGEADPSNSGIAFTKPTDLARYLAVFDGSPFPAERWHLHLKLAHHVDATQWLNAMPNGSTHTDPRPKAKQRPSTTAIKKRASGHVRLHLNQPVRHQRVTARRDTKRTGPTIRFVAHILAIMLGKGGL